MSLSFGISGLLAHSKFETWPLHTLECSFEKATAENGHISIVRLGKAKLKSLSSYIVVDVG